MRATESIMIDSESAFERMYASFRLFSSVGKRWGSQFVPVSAGVNWSIACQTVLQALKVELESACTYRNYGRAVGAIPITRVMEIIENAEAGCENFRVSIFNGATEGASMTIEALLEGNHIPQGSPTMMLGHGFPLYSLLSTRFHLGFHECLGDQQSSDGYLPSDQKILDQIDEVHPRIIFLLLPNNPLGEQLSPKLIQHLCDLLPHIDAYLLVDRVCQMSWDHRAPIMSALSRGISQGRVVILDSFSKSESLAGLRTGYAIANDEWIIRFEKMTKSRFLNPIVFSTVTLALTRLAESDASIAPAIRRLLEPRLAEIYSEYPSEEARFSPFETFDSFQKAYLKEQENRRAIIQNNFLLMQDRFENLAIKPLRLDSGFNVALTLPTMSRSREYADQYNLAVDHGVGVLPEFCFRKSINDGNNYFLRIGLTPPTQDFELAVDKMARYYGF